MMVPFIDHLGMLVINKYSTCCPTAGSEVEERVFTVVRERLPMVGSQQDATTAERQVDTVTDS